MSYKDYKKAVELIEKNKEGLYKSDGASIEAINLAEEMLDLKFSNLYREFLLSFGALSFNGEEIFGIVSSEDLTIKGEPNGIWLTLKERESSNLPNNLIVIYNTGYSELLCLDYNNVNKENEPRVVLFVPGVDLEYQTYEVISYDLGSFLLDRVNFALGSNLGID
ncbi:SMI1/KNR4 family protein [Clostridium perfringens]|uniref:SMI1/KNR4 family protein n=1 Tax=Clostridium perfringens TaxID=1502 RepID=UPI0024BC93B2|nr:SMI1/KNR4 family protein [Clostridium perfringens]